MERHAVFNGTIILEKDATVPVTVREVQSSFNVYEALRVLGGKVVHLSDHMKRLEESARVLHLPLPDVEWDKEIDKLIASDNISDATMRILVYGTAEPLWFITWSTLLSYPEEYYSNGVDAILYKGERFLPQCKTGNLLLNFLAREEASRHCAFEALLVDEKGRIREGTRSNFYLIKGNTLKTAPDEEVLGGVTRISVLRAAEALGYKIVLSSPEVDEIMDADASFISSTSMGAMSLRSVDGKSINVDIDRVGEICALVRKWELE